MPLKFEETSLVLEFSRLLSLIELKKCKLDFINLMRVNPITKLEQVTEAFVSFI